MTATVLSNAALEKKKSAHRPDHSDSPHSVDWNVKYEPLFQSVAMQVATTCPDLEPTREQVLTIRMVAFALSCEHLELLNGLLLGEAMPFNFPHDYWTMAVQDYLDGKSLMEVQTAQSFMDIINLLPPGGGKTFCLLINKVTNLPTGQLRP